MALSNVVKHFATETFTDAFSAATLVGRIGPFSEVTNSGSSAERRILETPVTETIPAGRVVVTPDSQPLLVGERHTDYWRGTALRYKYPIIPVHNLGTVGDIGEILAATPSDAAVYAYPFFIGRDPNAEERSDYLSRFEIYFSSVKSFVRGQVLVLDDQYYRLKSTTTVDPAGFAMALGVQLESPVQTMTVYKQGSTYDPATDSYSPTTMPGITCFVEPLMQDYEFVSPSFTAIEPGDKAISVLKSAVTIETNDHIGNYVVQSVRDEGDWILSQCRYLGS